MRTFVLDGEARLERAVLLEGARQGGVRGGVGKVAHEQRLAGYGGARFCRHGQVHLPVVPAPKSYTWSHNPLVSFPASPPQEVGRLGTRLLIPRLPPPTGNECTKSAFISGGRLAREPEPGGTRLGIM